MQMDSQGGGSEDENFLGEDTGNILANVTYQDF